MYKNKFQNNQGPTQNVSQDVKTLWVGDIEQWMDESQVTQMFSNVGQVQNCKLIRDKGTGLPVGYGFVEFSSHQQAGDILNSYNGKPLPGGNKSFRLNWGVHGGGGNRQQNPHHQQGGHNRPLQNNNMGQNQDPQQQGHSIYVAELDQSVTESILTEFFSQKYGTVVSSKIVVDPQTKQSKGFGFVKFSNQDEAGRAIKEMQGAVLRGRAIKTSEAFNKGQQQDPRQQHGGGNFGGGYKKNFGNKYQNNYDQNMMGGMGMQNNMMMGMYPNMMNQQMMMNPMMGGGYQNYGNMYQQQQGYYDQNQNNYYSGGGGNNYNQGGYGGGHKNYHNNNYQKGGYQDQGYQKGGYQKQQYNNYNNNQAGNNNNYYKKPRQDMENEENVEPSMAYNTEYQENNFKADFINSSKMNKIM